MTAVSASSTLTMPAAAAVVMAAPTRVRQSTTADGGTKRQAKIAEAERGDTRQVK